MYILNPHKAFESFVWIYFYYIGEYVKNPKLLLMHFYFFPFITYNVLKTYLKLFKKNNIFFIISIRFM